MFDQVSNEELRRIKSGEYWRMASNVLDKAQNVLRLVILELSKDDYPKLWAEQYRITRDEPIADRMEVVQQDTSGCIVKTVNKYLQENGVGSGIEVRKSGVQSQRDEDALKGIPNDIFVPAVENWLRGLSTYEQEHVARFLVDTLDKTGYAKCFLFTKIDDRPVMMERLEQKYGSRANPDKRFFSNKLHSYISYRNKFWAHASTAKLSTMTEVDWNQSVNDVQGLIGSFAQSENAEIREAVTEFDKCVKDCLERVSLPAIVISDVETKHQLQPGSLSRTLFEFREFKEKMDKAGKVILFAHEDELVRYYKVRYRDLDVAQKMEVKLETITGNTLKFLELKQLNTYRDKRLTPEQIDEITSQFMVMLDLETLYSDAAMKVVTRVLGPSVGKFKRCLLVEWGTLSHLYRTETDTDDDKLRKQAHKARMQLYHLQKTGLIRYVGSMDHRIDPDESLLDFVRSHCDIPICVVTTNRVLAARLNTVETPNCLTITNWGEDGLMVRTISKHRLAMMCESGLHFGRESQAVSISGSGDREEKSDLGNNEDDKVVPKVGDLLWDENGAPVKLEKSLGEGGEGVVYCTDRPGLVAKVYLTKRLSAARYEKLKTMRTLDVSHEYICWPQLLLHDEERNFVGFLMSRAPENVVEMGLSIFKLGSERVQQKILPGWDRYSLARACASVSSTFAYLHRKNILMGDVNPRNLLVSPADPSKVYFVDCDSYQVGKYVCPVGMAEYSSPEILRRIESAPGGYADCPRTVGDEQFAVAGLLFRILMLGQMPFAAKNNEKIEDAIRSYSFAYRTKENRGEDVPDGPYALIWNNTPPNVRERFAQVFTGNGKLSAEEWHNEFRKYIGNLVSGRSSTELLPRKYYDATGNFFKDFMCVGCNEEANMPAEKYDRLVKYNQPVLCNRCMSLLWPLQERKATITCDICRRPYAGTLYEKAMQEYGKRCKCPGCKNRSRWP